MNHKKNRGFTLIELLVVVAIISLLTSTVLAQLRDARKRAVDTKILAEFQQLRTALEIYYNENGKYPSPAPGYYCISDNVSNCSIAGVTVSGQTLNQALAIALNSPLNEWLSNNSFNLTAAALLSYKPSTGYSISGNKGFIYYMPSGTNPVPKIILSTNKTGVVNTTVGIWTLSSGSI